MDTYPEGCCEVCGGEPEVCAETDSHTWVTCRECGSDMRPEWDTCQDCGALLPAVIPGSVELATGEGCNDAAGSEVAQVRKEDSMELTVQDGPNTPESVRALAWSVLYGGEGLDQSQSNPQANPEYPGGYPSTTIL